MRPELLLKFRQLEVKPTGLYEVTGYHDVDIALGNYISRIVDNVRLCEPNDINKAFADFTDRPISDKVIVGRFDDVPQLLRHIKMAQAGRPSEHHDKHRNPDYLPLVNLSRNFMISIGNVDRAIQTRNHEQAVIYDGMGLKPRNVIAVCASQPATLTYDLNILGADKESTSLLCNALGMQLVELLDTGFKAKTRLATGDFELDCALDAVKGFMLSDASPQSDTDRFYCATTQLTVITEVITAYNVQAINATINVFEPQTLDEK
ncbi:hypothetical protein UXN85_20505 [Enterobacter hormaechei]